MANPTSNTLIREEYRSSTEPYEIEVPEIQSGDTYYFTTESGLMYQVRFGKKRENYLCNILNFSVLSDEFEDEYSETNRGEVYRIIATIIDIADLYHRNHPHSESYEFTGEFKEEHETQTASIRSRLYYRYAKRVLNSNWKVILDQNKVIIQRNK
jgi:hypothetical protein